MHLTVGNVSLSVSLSSPSSSSSDCSVCKLNTAADYPFISDFRIGKRISTLISVLHPKSVHP